MNNNIFASIGFPVCSLFFVVFIAIMYVNKRKYKNIENTLFITLLTLSFCCIFAELISVYFLQLDNAKELSVIFACKTFLALMISWIVVFITYILALLTKHYDPEIKKRRRKIIAIVMGIVGLASLIIMAVLKIDTTSHNIVYSFTGEATYIAYILGGLGILLSVYALIIKHDIVKKEQRTTISIAVILVAITLSVQFFMPEYDYNIQNFQFTLLLLALYFTLENQDNKILEEHEIQKQEADEANKAQTEFLTSMSHEIRTPMNTIIGFSDALIREGATSEEVVKADIKYVHSAAITLLDLINNILDLSRVDSQKEQIVEKEYDTDQVIVELDTAIKSKLENTSIKYTVEVDPNLPKRLFGDYVKINKVIGNLVSNIISYSKDGSIDLKVTTRINENNEQAILFNIRSNGSVVGEEEFNKYYLNEKDTNNVNTKVLELNVARVYARMLGSEVKMTNSDRFNLGYDFEITQQVIVPTPLGDIKVLLEKKEEEIISSFEGKKALVVDDNTINIKLIERFLKEFKLEVESVTSGNECIEKIMNTNYDIVFLDHMMPVKDGLQTLDELKDKKSELPPVIALTANAYSGVKDFYVNAGFQDYLAKPVSRGDLAVILNKFLK